MDESWLGGGICLAVYAETIEYIGYMQRTVPDDDDDDDDDAGSGAPPWDSNPLDPPKKKIDFIT